MNIETLNKERFEFDMDNIPTGADGLSFLKGEAFATFKRTASREEVEKVEAKAHGMEVKEFVRLRDEMAGTFRSEAFAEEPQPVGAGDRRKRRAQKTVKRTKPAKARPEGVRR